MATLNGIPLVSKGRIGDYTIYQRDGRLTVRSRLSESKRPCHPSEGQMRQRTCMSNIVNLWRAFPTAYRPMFEQRRRGVSSYNMFVTYAMKATPIYLTKRMASENACVLTDVLVSQGSLREIVVGHDGVAPHTNIQLGGLTIDPSTTVRQLAKAVLNNNDDFLPDDSLRYYVGEQRWVNNEAKPDVTIRCTELVLDLDDDTPLRLATGNSPGFAQRGGWLAASHEVVGGMAWVHLCHGSGGTLLSTQRLVCHNDEMMTRYSSEEAFAEAMESYLGN